MTNEMWKEMSHKYIPKVDDYVVWEKEKLEGWVYFADKQYVTIEFAVKDKSDDHVHFHKKVHCCVRTGVSNLYFISALGGVNRGVIASLFVVVEPPDSTNNIAAVRIIIVVAQPNGNHIALERVNFITVTFWGFVWEITG